ncbi:MAG: hypothetical protein WBD47_08875 [Phormidesmis sp.]
MGRFMSLKSALLTFRRIAALFIASARLRLRMPLSVIIPAVINKHYGT